MGFLQSSLFLMNMQKVLMRMKAICVLSGSVSLSGVPARNKAILNARVILNLVGIF